MAPYQILLHDGRLIFAPQDSDQVIRLREPPAADAPSSPEINYSKYLVIVYYTRVYYSLCCIPLVFVFSGDYADPDADADGEADDAQK